MFILNIATRTLLFANKKSTVVNSEQRVIRKLYAKKNKCAQRTNTIQIRVNLHTGYTRIIIFLFSYRN